jgi:alkylhydroperoxidase/carboxymuconolactone decarboxylase family protein YurZ
MIDREEAGYLPAIYERVRADFPEAMRAYEALSDALHTAGPLPDRERRLVKLALAVGAEAEGAVRSQVRKALGEGIARQEIEHAIVLGVTTVGFPATVAALGWAREVFEARR